jgi:glycosyltransferase involved in cell wall biosynthesis
VDNDYFAAKGEEFGKQKAESRKKFGLPEKYFLASARFVEKKNLFRLVQAYALYREKAESRKQKAEIWDLVLLGDGPLRKALDTQLSTLNLHNHVRLPGFKQYDELPAYFGLAGAFVHASTTEQWGLVVNEAMASGLPVLVSSRCGCAADLVQEGVNGFTFDPRDIEQLAELMLRVSDCQFPISDFGAASRRIISAWGPEQFANGLRNAVAVALKNPRPRAGLLDRSLIRLALVTVISGVFKI